MNNEKPNFDDLPEEFQEIIRKIAMMTYGKVTTETIALVMMDFERFWLEKIAGIDITITKKPQNLKKDIIVLLAIALSDLGSIVTLVKVFDYSVLDIVVLATAAIISIVGGVIYGKNTTSTIFMKVAKLLGKIKNSGG